MVDAEVLKSSNSKISDTLKALNRALAKEDRAKKSYDKAKADVKATKDAYLFALEDAKKAIV